jgi:hypothetical protein
MDENKRNLFSNNALKLVKKFELPEIVDAWEKLFHELKSKK